MEGEIMTGPLTDERRSIAEGLAKDLLTAWSNGRSEVLGDEAATTVMQSRLSPERQREICRAVQDLFGDFQSIAFIEAWEPAEGLPSAVYRFAGRFSKGGEGTEIRVAIDGKGRLAAFCIKPWRIKVS